MGPGYMLQDDSATHQPADLLQQPSNSPNGAFLNTCRRFVSLRSYNNQDQDVPALPEEQVGRFLETLVHFL